MEEKSFMESVGVNSLFDIYKNKNVLITGHTGFKGSWLATWLLKIGANISGYALNPKTISDNFNLCGLSSKINDYREDIRDYQKLTKIFKEEKPDVIFHLAAQPLVLESYNDPRYTIEVNTQGTANILEVFRNSKSARVLIVITTDKVYRNNEWEWSYREIDRLGGNDPYSASKAAAELLVSSYQKSFFKNNEKLLVSVRAGNVIGGGDWSENRIVPDFIKSLKKNEAIVLRNPYATRPWQHVLEPLGGYLHLGARLLQNHTELVGAWNFGPYLENVVNVESLVKKLIKCYGNGEYKNDTKISEHAESNFLSLDISKAITQLNWKPILNFTETIKLTVDWYKKYSSCDVFNLCLKQIEDYQNLWKLKNTN